MSKVKLKKDLESILEFQSDWNIFCNMSRRAYFNQKVDDILESDFQGIRSKLLRQYPKVKKHLSHAAHYDWQAPFSNLMVKDFDVYFNSLSKADSLYRIKLSKSRFPQKIGGDIHPIFFNDIDLWISAGSSILEVAIGNLEYKIENWRRSTRIAVGFILTLGELLDWIEKHPRVTTAIVIIILFTLNEVFGWSIIQKMLDIL